MGSLRFSHVLLIIAVSSWLLALSANLFFPFLLYTFSAAPLFLGTVSSIFEIPAHYLLELLPVDRQDYLSMICFLLAIACSFVAGSVYGMEKESERYSLYFDAENTANLSSTHTDYYYDLEKGKLPPYTEHEESSYTDEKSSYTPYTDVLSSSPGSSIPVRDAMAGVYYPSLASFEHARSQARAQREFIASNRSADRMINDTHLSNITHHGCFSSFDSKTGAANGFGGSATTHAHRYLGGSARTTSFIPATPRLTPSIPTTYIPRLHHTGQGVTGEDRSAEGGKRYASAVLEDFEDVGLFDIYEIEGAREGGKYDFDAMEFLSRL